MLRRRLLLLAAFSAATVAHIQTPRTNAQSPIPAGAPLTGHAAQDSPPARAFAALLQVVSKGDFPSIRAALTSDHPGLGLLNPEGLQLIKAELLPNRASPAAVMATLASVYGGHAQATLVFGVEPSPTIWKMRRQSDGWKLSP
jgi:hypothetical protein